jgi:hypothetical protein
VSWKVRHPRGGRDTVEDRATGGLKYAVATWHNCLLLWPHLCPVDQPGTSATRTLSKIELFQQAGERGYNQEDISKSHPICAWRVTRSHQKLFAMTQSSWIWSAASWDSLRSTWVWCANDQPGPKPPPAGTPVNRWGITTRATQLRESGNPRDFPGFKTNPRHVDKLSLRLVSWGTTCSWENGLQEPGRSTFLPENVWLAARGAVRQTNPYPVQPTNGAHTKSRMQNLHNCLLGHSPAISRILQRVHSYCYVGKK